MKKEIVSAVISTIVSIIVRKIFGEREKKNGKY